MKKVNWKQVLKIAGVVLYAALFLVSAKLIFTYAYNEFTNKQLEEDNTKGSYEVLQYLNFPQSYIAYYNQGNLEYRRGQYEKAIEEYEKALEEPIPHGEECKVRINAALSYIATLPSDYDVPDKIPDSLETLYTARDILLEQECAKDEGRGHNTKAQRLKEEIDEEIERLEELLEQQQDDEEDEENGSSGNRDNEDNQSGSGGNGDEEQNGGSSEEDEEQQWEDQIQQQLQQQAEESYQERQNELQLDEELYSDDYYDYDSTIRRW